MDEYVILFNTEFPSILFHGKFNGKNDPNFIKAWERATCHNYGNKNCYIIVNERAYNSYIEMFNMLRIALEHKNNIEYSINKIHSCADSIKEIVDELNKHEEKN